jgi:hypothetical protein
VTSGAATPADDRPARSGSTPTDSLLIDRDSLTGAIMTAFKTGWQMGRQLTMFSDPPEITFELEVNSETREVILRPRVI